MGNRGSQLKGKMTRSATIQASRQQATSGGDIARSKSLNELNRRSSSMRSSASKRNASKSASRPKLSITTTVSAGSSRLSSGSQRNIKRESPHPLSAQGREIIQSCFENPHADIANRICMRIFEKRNDYQRFIHALGKEKWPWLTNTLQEFLEEVVLRVDDVATVEQISRKYGEEHVMLKSYGFKPDFWVSLADAITVECVILDMANHQPTDTVAAWSQFVTLLFSSIRDGYYAALRQQRQSSKRIRRQATVESTQSVAADSTVEIDGSDLPIPEANEQVTPQSDTLLPLYERDGLTPSLSPMRPTSPSPLSTQSSPGFGHSESLIPT